MTALTCWRDRSRLSVQISLLALCGLVAVAVLRLVGAYELGDASELALIGGAAFAFFLATITAIVLARSARAGLGRRILHLSAGIFVLLELAFLNASYADVSIDIEGLLKEGKPDEARSSIAVGPGGRDVRLVGTMGVGDAGRLETLLVANPNVTRIHLTSDGGLADEGQAIGDVIAAHRLTTYVPDYCVSACTLAFIRGRDRVLMRHARLGFHSPYEVGLFGRTFAGDPSVQRAAYLAAGIAPTFVDRALAVDPADLWVPDDATLIDDKVVTGIVDRYRLPDSNLDGSVDLASARTLVLRNVPMFEGFSAASPATIDEAAVWYYAGYLRGRSEGVAIDGLRAVINLDLARVFLSADDVTLGSLALLLTRAISLAPTPRACLAVGFDGDLDEAARLLETAQGAEEGTIADLVRVALGTRPASHRETTIEGSGAGHDRPSCTEVRDAFDAMSRQPEGTRAALVRRIFARAMAQATSIENSITPAALTGP